jgi:hypothetical protein
MPDRSHPNTPCDYKLSGDCECDVPCRAMLDADPNWPPTRNERIRAALRGETPPASDDDRTVES